MKRDLRKVFWWAVYYGVAARIPAWLPSFRWFRAYCAHRFCTDVATTAHINKGARISRHCHIGHNSGIGAGATLMDHVHIGSDVMMGAECYFITGDHEMPGDHQRFQEMPAIVGPIHVEDGVFFGTRVIVMPGVRIGKGAAVGAGSVVTKDVAPGATVAGNPAREIRPRREV